MENVLRLSYNLNIYIYCHIYCEANSVGVLTLGYSNIIKLLVEISVLKHEKYTKTVTSKCETVI